MNDGESNKNKLEKVKFKNSLMTKLNGSIILILILCILILGFLINNVVSKTLTQSAEEINLEVARTLKSEVDAFFNQAENVVNLISTREELKKNDTIKLKKLFKRIKEDYPEFLFLYLGTTTGEMKSYPEADWSDFDPRTRPWYKKAKEEDRVIWTDFYTDAVTGKPVITVAIPVKNNSGEFIGVLGVDITLKTLSAKIASKKIGEEGYAFMVDKKGRTIAHPNSKMVETQYNVNQVFKLEDKIKGKEGSFTYSYEGEGKLASYIHFDKLDGNIFAQVPFAEVYAIRNKIRNYIIGFSILALVIISIVISFINNIYLLKPLKKVIASISRLAEGNFTTTEVTGRQDEIGRLEVALDKMADNLRKMITNVSDTAENLSAYSEELSASAEEGNASIESTTQLIEDMSAAIQEISASTEEISSFTEEADNRTQLGNTNIQKTVSSIEEISNSVQNTVEVIKELDNNSKEIGQVIELITNIAEQTNLLALNAAIEAARAGEHGQGFAVVADEIRELAEETSKATDKIANLVKSTQQRSKVGLQSIQKVETQAINGEKIAVETGEIFKKIENSSKEISVQVEQAAASTQNLAENSDRIMNAAEDIKAMSYEVTDSSQELAHMAEELQHLIAKFKI
jgi:methyl-accepting chemotaxis protein